MSLRLTRMWRTAPWNAYFFSTTDDEGRPNKVIITSEYSRAVLLLQLTLRCMRSDLAKKTLVGSRYPLDTAVQPRGQSQRMKGNHVALVIFARRYQHPFSDPRLPGILWNDHKPLFYLMYGEPHDGIDSHWVLLPTERCRPVPSSRPTSSRTHPAAPSAYCSPSTREAARTERRMTHGTTGSTSRSRRSAQTLAAVPATTVTRRGSGDRLDDDGAGAEDGVRRAAERVSRPSARSGTASPPCAPESGGAPPRGGGWARARRPAASLRAEPQAAGRRKRKGQHMQPVREHRQEDGQADRRTGRQADRQARWPARKPRLIATP